MQSLKKAVMLDFDGVVLRRNPISQCIYHRCQRYVQKHTGMRNPIKLQEVNKELYDACGHTALGLQKLGYENVTLSEFNEFVYSNLDMRELRENCDDGDDLRAFVDSAYAKGMRVYIFSNAPDTWCKEALSLMGAPELPSVYNAVTSQYLKPTQAAYDAVERIVEHDVDKIVFVDDKIINHLPILNNPRWESVLMTTGLQEQVVKIKSVKVVQSLRQVSKLL
jgi:FMN phosphatase YigB (HAD superfamily)